MQEATKRLPGIWKTGPHLNKKKKRIAKIKISVRMFLIEKTIDQPKVHGCQNSKGLSDWRTSKMIKSSKKEKNKRHHLQRLITKKKGIKKK